MEHADLLSLAQAVADVRELLRQYGDIYTEPRLRSLEERLARGDLAAVQTAHSEAVGGMGWLNDRYLCVENGDLIESAEQDAANARLRAIVLNIELLAQAAASSLGLQLIP